MTDAARRVLIVDDFEPNRKILARFLHRQGFEVLLAENGHEALSAIDRQTIDIVLLDIMMPDMDGIETLRQLREKYSRARLPIIMTTAKDQTDDIVTALDLGANDYVTKPLDLPVVLARMRAHLDREPAAETSAAVDSTKADANQPLFPAIASDPTLSKGCFGNYTLMEQLGQGGNGVVFRARNMTLDKVVALKVLPKFMHFDEQAVRRFNRETRAIGRLDHPNVVHAYDAGVVDGTPFIAMEMIEGPDLARLVKRHRVLPVAEACELARQTALGLQHVHEAGLIHRDVKPSNLLLNQQGRLKVSDFGIAHLIGDVDSRLTAAGQLMGTSDYMAPEQWDSLPLDIRADIYGLGCTLYNLLCGRPPFAIPGFESPIRKMVAHLNEPPPWIDNDKVSPALFDVLLRMLAKNRDQRFATPAEVADALAPFAEGSSESRLTDLACEELPRGGDADTMTSDALLRKDPPSLE